MNQTRPFAARVPLIVDPATLIAAAPGIELGTSPRMTGFGGIRQITPMQVCIGEFQ
jgi:hypothetical protein